MNPELSRCLRAEYQEIRDFGPYAVWKDVEPGAGVEPATY